MNRISLAAKYLTRRKSRACLILIVFLVINIMAFIIISIRESANDALAKLDQKPLDYFYLESQYETDPKTVIAEGSSISFLSVPYVITDEVIEKIKSIHGINAYASHYAFLSGMLSDKNGNPLELAAYNIPVSKDDAASIRGVSDSDLYLDSTIKLTAGRHIMPDSKREAMVNVQFAKQNDLNIGDKLTITTPGHTSGIEVTLSGIYENTDNVDETEFSPSELRENFIYVDYGTAHALDDRNQGIISVKFFVDQPDQLASIYAQAQKLDMDWNKYYLFDEADASVIDADAVKAVSNQFSVLTAVIILAGFLVITFVLMLQTKMRANEIGILLSLGFTKSRILLQHIIEVMIPAGISIAAAYFIGDHLISSERFQITVTHIQMVTTLQIIAINLCLLMASIWISSARLLHTTPKAIFEKNN
ncbi:ABC transporter permease [Blautia marasmi]|uniref:ABC transporter permease n=1 Tax=Blautia marasmi TaxID=1917868 RepID=UPI00266D135C|nr:ABC transporter permease [Blautia marasmi]